MKLKPVVASLVMLGLTAPVLAKSSIVDQQNIIDKNAVVSTICNDAWFNRITVAGRGNVVAMVGNHDFPGTFTRADNASDLYVNNLNLLVNAKLSDWSKATVNLAYLGAPIPWNNLDVNYDPTASATATNSAAYRHIDHRIILDEGYVTISNLAKTPFYFQVGKKYVPFGSYKDPYVPYQIMSPAQMLAQMNGVTAVLGVSSDFGLYASVFALRGETYSIGSNTGNIRNFGGTIGYYDDMTRFHLNNASGRIEVGYVNNLWDGQFFGPNPSKLAWFERSKGADGVTNVKNNHPGGYEMDRVGGVSVHADFSYKAFSMYADWVTAVKDMVKKSYSSENSSFWGANVNAQYAFKTLNHDSHLGAGIQWSGHGSWFANNTGSSSVDLVTDWTRLVPKWRVLGEYGVNVYKNTDLSFVVSHGKSFDFTKALFGSKDGRNTTLGLVRLAVQF